MLTHWSYVFSALIHRYDDIMTWKRIRHYWYFVRELPWSPVDSTHKRAKNAQLRGGWVFVASVTQRPLSQTGFPSQFKFNGKFVLYHINFNIVISTKLCSCAVMACWKNVAICWLAIELLQAEIPIEFGLRAENLSWNGPGWTFRAIFWRISYIAPDGKWFLCETPYSVA